MWSANRDAEKQEAENAERVNWDWYQVKLRLPYMYTEAGRGIIIVEVKARDKEHAQEEAKKVLKGRSMTRCTWIAVNNMTNKNV